MTASITCHIYRSSRKDRMYLYVVEKDGFDVLPASLRSQFGPPEWAMELELTAARRLAHADTAQVMAALNSQGFYLQMPPKDPWL